MDKNNYGMSYHKNSIIVFGFILSLTLIICALIGRSTLIKVKGYGNTISVTGAAFKPIISDMAIWEAEITTTSETIESGYSEIKSDIERVKKFMSNNGFEPDEYKIQGVNISKNFNRDRIQTGVTLRQLIKVELNDVDRVTKLYRDASSLLEKGVEINSRNPRYLFTGLDSLKLEMIKAATENAKLRAEQLAETTGKEVGAPKSARVGVFQIRPLHSQEVSSYGISDVSSIEKEIVCTVHIGFLIE